MKTVRKTICLAGLPLLFACSEEPPPKSVFDFMENPRLLEATMVRCAQNRSESRYLAECVNAREAVNRIEAAQEKTRREDLEKQSEQKRQALRRTQEAAAEARRRAEEAKRRQEEQEYLGIFEQPVDSVNDSGAASGPSSVVPSGAPSAGNAPGVAIAPPPVNEAELAVDDVPPEPETNLEAVREELRRRQEPPR